MIDIQDKYNKTLLFAANKHNNQKLPGSELPYLSHVVSVAMEVTIAGYNTPGFDIPFAMTVALLHDTMEDTNASYIEVKNIFGEEVADSVLALTKFQNLEKAIQMQNSLDRIKDLKHEVWAVKLADRISNLEAPALDWKYEKRNKYKEGALNILKELGSGNIFLAKRLEDKISEYEVYVVTGLKKDAD